MLGLYFSGLLELGVARGGALSNKIWTVVSDNIWDGAGQPRSRSGYDEQRTLANLQWTYTVSEEEVFIVLRH